MKRHIFSEKLHILRNFLISNTNVAASKISDLFSQAHFVGSEVFIAVTMKNAVFWYVATCGSYKNRRFGGTCHLHFQGRKSASEKKRQKLASRMLNLISFVFSLALKYFRLCYMKVLNFEHDQRMREDTAQHFSGQNRENKK
jgi:hypothetical protein